MSVDSLIEQLNPRRWRLSFQILACLFGTYFISTWLASLVSPYKEYPPPPEPIDFTPVTFNDHEELDLLCQSSHFSQHSLPDSHDSYHSIRRVVLNASIGGLPGDGPMPVNFLQDEFVDPSYEEIISCRAHDVIIPKPIEGANKLAGNDLMFAYATTTERYNESFDLLSSYLAYLGSPALFHLPAKTDNDSLLVNSTQMEAWFQRDDIYGIIKYANQSLNYTERWFHSIEMMYNTSVARNMSTKWYILLDDDTFIVSPYKFLKMLDKYDHNQLHYIGCLSESRGQRDLWGFMPFGGAGLIMSQGLVKKMMDHWEECKFVASKFETGDLKAAACVRYIKKGYQGIYFSIEPGLHQLDLRGDISGFLQGGLSYITFHHLSGWSRLIPDRDNKKSLKLLLDSTRAIGEAAMWRRYRFKETWLLTNGYSLTEYINASSIPSDNSLQMLEKTFENDADDFITSYGRMRRNLVEGKDKRSYWISGIYERELAQNGKRHVTMVYENLDLETGKIRRIDVEWLAP